MEAGETSEETGGSAESGWLVIGVVLGEKLPPDAYFIGELQLMPLTEEQMRQALPIMPKNVQTTFEGENGPQSPQFQVAPHAVTVKSPWGFSVPIHEAADYDDAEEQAQNHISRARQALTIAVGSPYIFEVRRIIGPAGAASPSGEVAGRPVDVNQLLPEDAAASSRYATQLEKDPVARSAGRYMDRATTLELAVIGMPEGQPGVLHSYFMALEGVVRKVVKDARSELQDTTKEREGIIEQLVQDLAAQVPLDRKSQLVRQANNALARLDLFYLDLQIAEAAQILELPEEVARLAQDFNHFRNEYLGHYRSQIPGEAIRYWFDERRCLAVTTAYLRAYLERIPGAN